MLHLSSRFSMSLNLRLTVACERPGAPALYPLSSDISSLDFGDSLVASFRAVLPQ
jgi:hypothetical protein